MKFGFAPLINRLSGFKFQGISNSITKFHTFKNYRESAHDVLKGTVCIHSLSKPCVRTVVINLTKCSWYGSFDKKKPSIQMNFLKIQYVKMFL